MSKPLGCDGADPELMGKLAHGLDHPLTLVLLDEADSQGWARRRRPYRLCPRALLPDPQVFHAPKVTHWSSLFRDVFLNIQIRVFTSTF
jgi:hypothetical protein